MTDRADRSRTQLLIVEDDAAMREMLYESLTDEGYKVDLAAGGRAGIERVRRGGVDLVVTDVKMPDLDGLDALLSIVQMPPGVPVATVGVDNAKNAAVLAARILALL